MAGEGVLVTQLLPHPIYDTSGFQQIFFSDEIVSLKNGSPGLIYCSSFLDYSGKKQVSVIFVSGGVRGGWLGNMQISVEQGCPEKRNQIP